MKKVLQIITLCTLLSAIAIPVMILDSGEGERQAFSGWVTHIDWRSRNHGAPLVIVKRKNNTEIKFWPSGDLVDSSRLKLGDAISKMKGSKFCIVNGQPIGCIK